MSLYIGIDLGTSAVKLLLADSSGNILNKVSKRYPLMIPAPGWSEQDPEEWWEACRSGLAELLSGFDASLVAGIGADGQMHGLVILDDEDRVIRPAILWNDGRTEEEVKYLNETIGKEKISGYTANIAFAGFTAPKLLWLRKHEPENFRKISKIMLPKDYINYKLTGVHSSDFSDASGMLLLDVRNKCWSEEMLDLCGIKEEQMPQLYESYDVTGSVKEDIAGEFGLRKDVKVVAGAGDNAAAAIGACTVKDGACNISIGTSGTMFIASDQFRADPNNALHSFAHADGRYHLMGCMLSAASCNTWFCRKILGTHDYDAEHAAITEEMLGRNHVFFLPYLMGERSPLNDINARGTFTGMSMDTERADMVQAVLEGVAFALRDSLEIARSLGINIESSTISGGGVRSDVWRNILANVLGIKLEIPKTEEGPGYGATMLAMVGCGEYESTDSCAEAFHSISNVTEPDPEISALYDQQYQKFRMIYPALKEVFPEIL